MKIDICIPAYNEVDIIEEAVRRVREVLPDARVIVADNGSTDGTGERVRTIPGVAVLPVSKRGKGAAVVAAARMSDADVFGFVDADLSADPKDLPRLVEMVSAGADLVIGSRFKDAHIVRRGLFRSFSSRVFNVLQRTIVGVPVSDTQCGMKLMNARGRELLRSCKETGWFFDIELLAYAHAAGAGVKEVPVHWEENRFVGRASKLRIVRDAIQGVVAMLRIKSYLYRYGTRRLRPASVA